jgi:thiamine-monophosphate kinase
VLAGGNFARADRLSLHITAFGDVPRGKALTRSAARPGDQVYVSGTLGDAALALALRSIDRNPGKIATRQLRPEPRLKLGQLARGWARAAIDLSDGLLQDLGHLAQASGVSLEIDPHQVPVSRTFKDLATNPDLALTGGEDYELALCVPAAKAAAFERACARAGEQVTRIGSVGKGRGVKVKAAPHLAAGGFDHFAGKSAASPRRPAGRRAN